MNKIETKVAQLVEPVISEMGIELVGVEVNRNGKNAELTIFIDKEGGVFLEDCENVSRRIDEIVEAADPIEESYVLCVSSPGLDRPLKTKRDFEKSVGKKVDVKLYKPFEGKKQFTGTLTEFNDETFTIITGSDDDLEMIFTHKEVAQVRLHIDF